MTQPTSNEETPVGQTMTPSQVRMVWWAVIIMGIMLVVGFFVVVGKIIHEGTKVGKKPDAVPSVAQSVSPISGALAPEVSVALPSGSIVKSSTLNGNTLIVHSSASSGDQVTIVDLVSGKVLSRVTLTK